MASVTGAEIRASKRVTAQRFVLLPVTAPGSRSVGSRDPELGRSPVKWDLRDACRNATSIMIQLTGAAKHYGPKILFENVDWLVTPNERTGVVGANGS